MSKKFPHYWMCNDCAVKMGGKPTGGVCTVIKGICKYCEAPDDRTLIPWVDFDWPKDREKNRVAKAARD